MKKTPRNVEGSLKGASSIIILKYARGSVKKNRGEKMEETGM